MFLINFFQFELSMQNDSKIYQDIIIIVFIYCQKRTSIHSKSHRIDYWVFHWTKRILHSNVQVRIFPPKCLRNIYLKCRYKMKNKKERANFYDMKKCWARNDYPYLFLENIFTLCEKHLCSNLRIDHFTNSTDAIHTQIYLNWSQVNIFR